MTDPSSSALPTLLNGLDDSAVIADVLATDPALGVFDTQDVDFSFLQDFSFLLDFFIVAVSDFPKQKSGNEALLPPSLQNLEVFSTLSDGNLLVSPLKEELG